MIYFSLQTLKQDCLPNQSRIELKFHENSNIVPVRKGSKMNQQKMMNHFLADRATTPKHNSQDDSLVGAFYIN
jgi:hypothetical protein